MSEQIKKGLGDKVESLIKIILPKTAEKKKDCKSCNDKKIWLNNFGAKFG
tara:strand:+ start:141 stop:290 length:150 start_codon:yes stop_codon:yes gene_type:complete